MKTKKTLQFDTFEDRIVPASLSVDIDFQADGDIEIVDNRTGVNNNNDISLMVTTDYFKLVDNASGHKVEFHKQNFPNPFTRDLVINLDGGRNKLVMENTRIPDDLIINNGGRNDFSLYTVQTGDDMKVDFRGGSDNLYVRNAFVHGRVDIDTRDGDDTVHLQASTILNQGRDNHENNIDLGEHDDKLTFEQMHVVGKVVIDDGDRHRESHDYIQLGHSTIGGQLKITERGGNDYVKLANMHVGHEFFYNPDKDDRQVGYGDDYLEVRDSQFASGRRDTSVIDFVRGYDDLKMFHNHFRGGLKIVTKGTLNPNKFNPAVIKDIGVNGDLDINLLFGRGDNLEIINAQVSDNVYIDGTDYLLIDRINARNMDIFTDGGSDVVKIFAAHIQHDLKVNLGLSLLFGDDRRDDNYLLINNLNAQNLEILGGRGDDRIDLFCIHVQNKIFVFTDGGNDSVYGNNVNSNIGVFIGGRGFDKLEIEHSHIRKLVDWFGDRYDDYTPADYNGD